MMGSIDASQIRCRNRLSSSSSGFSLLEAIIALAILAIALVSYLGLMTTTLDTERIATRKNAATNLVLDKLEEIRSSSFASVISGSDPPLNSAGLENQSDSFFLRSWVVSDNTPMTNTKTVQITCSWTEKGTARSVSVNTIVSL